MHSTLRSYVGVAMTFGLAVGFTAAVRSAVIEWTSHAQKVPAARVPADVIDTAPFDYFPSHYQNQGREIEPLPAQF